MDADRLRALGYVLDSEDRWVHPSLRLEAQDPHALLACDPDELERFHDGSLWEEVDPKPRPRLDSDLAGRVVRLDLNWDGWLGAWELQDGVYAGHEDLLAMGETLERTLSGLRAWQTRHDRRLLGSCLGMAVMLLWVFFGWLSGLPIWLGGFAVIAVLTWLVRPVKRPDALFGSLEVDMIPKALAKGRDALGEGWEEIADAVAAIPLDSEHVRLAVLERNVAIQRLKAAFQPDGLAQILHALAPAE